MSNTMLNVPSFIEPEINREASDYISNNYTEIITQIKKMGVSEEKAFDLLNDVYVSIVEAENEGNGYNMNKAKDGGYILVSQFVYGRVKGYTKNIKYSTQVIEKNKNYESVASSNDGNDFENMTSFQKAYATAGSYDNIEDVEDNISIRECVDYCLEFDDVTGLRMIELFKHLDILDNKEINKSLFDGLKSAFKIHDEFKEAFQNVLEYAIKHKTNFELLLETY